MQLLTHGKKLNLTNEAWFWVQCWEWLQTLQLCCRAKGAFCIQPCWTAWIFRLLHVWQFCRRPESSSWCNPSCCWGSSEFSSTRHRTCPKEQCRSPAACTWLNKRFEIFFWTQVELRSTCKWIFLLFLLLLHNLSSDFNVSQHLLHKRTLMLYKILGLVTSSSSYFFLRRSILSIIGIFCSPKSCGTIV